MDTPKHGLTLTTVKDLLRRASCTTLLEDDPFKYALRGFDVPRNVRAVEKDGIPMVVRYGTTVSPLEAEVTLFVAARTTVPVPDIYGVFSELTESDTGSITYIVEERLPGTTLRAALHTIDDAAREMAAHEVRTIFSELATLTGSPLRDRPIRRGPWTNAYFSPFQHHRPYGKYDARNTESFLRYFINYARSHPLTSDRASDRILDRFALSRPHIFSHGDLQFGNIMICEGHVSGC
ncbi:hypothetical protein C8T65DRAFT_832586 [Cerioporus squamosus]|nr:hypothetical protein C8T65DRAFT_832586 [Cerioporus squamosus]